MNAKRAPRPRSTGTTPSAPAIVATPSADHTIATSGGARLRAANAATANVA